MNRVGTVTHRQASVIVVRSDDDSHPAIGETVIDQSLDPVGRVVDVIGPVDRPYVIVDPDADRDTAALLDTRLYVR